MSAKDETLDLERLERWLASNLREIQGPIQLIKFRGGQSNPTYRLETSTGDYVLRRKPFGPVLPSAHAVDREYRLLAALHPTGYPVARPYALCTDDSVIGSYFYVMELVDGETFWDGKLPERTPEERRAIYVAMIETLARLHQTDYESVGLSDYGRPGNYFARQVERWTKQYRASQTDEIPEAEKLIEYLPRSTPEQTRSSIIHGDYRIDNLIYGPDLQIRAVLDWELSTIGDPLADFAYLAMNWRMQNDGGSGLEGLALDELGIPTLNEMVDIYCRATSRDGVPDLEWYFAYNSFRLMGILQGIKKRIQLGNASSAEAQAMAERVVPLARAGWRHAQASGA